MEYNSKLQRDLIKIFEKRKISKMDLIDYISYWINEDWVDEIINENYDPIDDPNNSRDIIL